MPEDNKQLKEEETEMVSGGARRVSCQNVADLSSKRRTVRPNPAGDPFTDFTNHITKEDDESTARVTDVEAVAK